MAAGLFEASQRCLAEPDPAAKCAAVSALRTAWEGGSPIGPPGRPARPQLVDPSQVPRRRLGSDTGRAALVHAIAHIEFNAINLALDAVYRQFQEIRLYYAFHDVDIDRYTLGDRYRQE